MFSPYAEGSSSNNCDSLYLIAGHNESCVVLVSVNNCARLSSPLRCNGPGAFSTLATFETMMQCLTQASNVGVEEKQLVSDLLATEQAALTVEMSMVCGRPKYRLHMESCWKAEKNKACRTSASAGVNLPWCTRSEQSSCSPRSKTKRVAMPVISQ